MIDGILARAEVIVHDRFLLEMHAIFVPVFIVSKTINWSSDFISIIINVIIDTKLNWFSLKANLLNYKILFPSVAKLDWFVFWSTSLCELELAVQCFVKSGM